jgi:hypothetical protein
MLSELNVVGNWFKNDSELGWRFDEIKLDDEAKKAFKVLDLDIEIHDNSARVTETSSFIGWKLYACI